MAADAAYCAFGHPCAADDVLMGNRVFKTCKRHRAEEADRRKRNRDQKTESGICVRCLRPAVVGQTRCQACGDKHRMYAQQRRDYRARCTAAKAQLLLDEIKAKEERIADQARRSRTITDLLALSKYEVLGNGDSAKRRARYRELMLEVHPDKCDDPRAKDVCAHLDAAKSVLVPC